MIKKSKEINNTLWFCIKSKQTELSNSKDVLNFSDVIIVILCSCCYVFPAELRKRTKDFVETLLTF